MAWPRKCVVLEPIVHQQQVGAHHAHSANSSWKYKHQHEGMYGIGSGPGEDHYGHVTHLCTKQLSGGFASYVARYWDYTNRVQEILALFL